MDKELETLRSKTERNELRARDAEARLRILHAEIDIIEQRERLEAMRQDQG